MYLIVAFYLIFVFRKLTGKILNPGTLVSNFNPNLLSKNRSSLIIHHHLKHKELSLIMFYIWNINGMKMSSVVTLKERKAPFVIQFYSNPSQTSGQFLFN